MNFLEGLLKAALKVIKKLVSSQSLWVNYNVAASRKIVHRAGWGGMDGWQDILTVDCFLIFA